MSSLLKTPAFELVRQLKSKDVSPVELMEETLNHIEKINPSLNAFVALRAEQAMKEARFLAEKISAGVLLGPLAGIPIGVKDLEDVKGMVTTYGSIPFKNNVAEHDSLQVARLKAAGAIVIGKTNTPEFGFTAFTKNRLFGVTRNPWDIKRTPGGSSGGSAAAVASGMVPVATGSDAGGSIRIPACYSGCFGMKPSSGRIPLGPVFPHHMGRIWTLGPITRSVRDAAVYLDCTAGYDPQDPESLSTPNVSYLDCLDRPSAPLKIAFSPTLGYARVEKKIMLLVKEAVNKFEDIGHRVEIWKGKLPEGSRAWSDCMNLDIYARIKPYFEKIRPELGHALVASLDKVKTLTVHDLIESQKTRTRINQKMREIFNDFDLLLTPTMPTEAFDAKGPPPPEIDGQPIPLLGAVAFTYPFNLSGHPAASVPIGLTDTGLPAGLQIIGPRLRDDLVLQSSYAFEQACPWENLWPEI